MPPMWFETDCAWGLPGDARGVCSRGAKPTMNESTHRLSPESIRRLTEDLAKHRSVGIRGIPCDHAGFGVIMTDALVQHTPVGIRTFVSDNIQLLTPVAILGIGTKGVQPWLPVLQGPFDDLETALDCLTRLVRDQDLSEPFDIEIAWNTWGKMWMNQLSTIVTAKDELRLRMDRQGNFLHMVIETYRTEKPVLDLFDEAIGYIRDHSGDRLIQVIASTPALFHARLEREIAMITDS